MKLIALRDTNRQVRVLITSAHIWGFHQAYNADPLSNPALGRFVAYGIQPLRPDADLNDMPLPRTKINENVWLPVPRLILFDFNNPTNQLDLVANVR